MPRISKEVLKRREYQRAYYASKRSPKLKKLAKAPGESKQALRQKITATTETMANNLIKTLIEKLSACLAPR